MVTTKTEKLEGPDLTRGIAVSDVADGQMLLGHAGGEPVLVTRKGSEWFAVGAVCTHYSGPLQQGLVVGHQLRCPWHHSCFDLRSGAPSTPALEPIPCYDVRLDGATLVVGAKRRFVSPAALTQPKHVVIIGAGASGAVTAEALRRFGHRGAITLLGSEGTLPVDRPNLSKDYLAGEAQDDWMLLRNEDFYRYHDIELRLDGAVVSVDPKQRTVTLKDGSEIAWDALVFATGAEPVQLQLPGAERIQTLRTLADSRAIIEKAKPGQRAVVIGASFIGLEVAASLRARNVDVRVVAPQTLPLESLLGHELATAIHEVHRRHGVAFHLGRRPAALEGGALTLDDRTTLKADFVVAGVGVRPRSELAERAGLRVDDGILVDAELRAAPGIYAVGDVARFPERRSDEFARIEHWFVAQRQGEAVARSMLGKGGPFRDTPFFWSTHYDMKINYVGYAPGWDRLQVDGDIAARDAAVHYYRRDKLLAVATLGRDLYALEVAEQFERD